MLSLQSCVLRLPVSALSCRYLTTCGRTEHDNAHFVRRSPGCGRNLVRFGDSTRCRRNLTRKSPTCKLVRIRVWPMQLGVFVCVYFCPNVDACRSCQPATRHLMKLASDGAVPRLSTHKTHTFGASPLRALCRLSYVFIIYACCCRVRVARLALAGRIDWKCLRPYYDNEPWCVCVECVFYVFARVRELCVRLTNDSCSCVCFTTKPA